MKQLVYVFRYLLKGHGNSLIKIISLTLGLVVGLVLYTQIAFELSFDNFYPEKERIFRIRRISLNGDKPKHESPFIYAPMPKCMKSDIQGIEEATLTASSVEEITFLSGDKKYVERVLNVDSCFLNVFQLPVLSGDAKKMVLPYQGFLSRSAAERIFGNSDPVGKTLLYVQYEYKKIPITVAGVFEDFPENASFCSDILLSINTIFAEFGKEPGWRMNDNYCGYIKLQSTTTPKEVEARIPAMLNNYYDVKAMEAKGFIDHYYLDPVTSLHKDNPNVKKQLIILAILAFSLLFVSAMNYVLISVSSLIKRGKSVGVYKTYGATNKNIFTRFMLETAVLIFISLLFSVLLIFVFRTQIEELIQTPLSVLFSFHNLWIVGLLIIVLMLIAGIIPAHLFSITPTMLVFRSEAVNKRYWKNLLLFIQFLSMTCMMCILFVIIRQYDMMVNGDWGYQMDKLIYVKLSGVPKERLNQIKSEFMQFPYVNNVSICSNIPISGMNGDAISDPETKENLFPYKLMGADKEFFDTYRINLQSGKNFEQEGNREEDVIVNETFVRMLKAHHYPLDRYFQNLDGKKRIVGVVKDFQLTNLYKETMPLLITSLNPLKGSLWFSTYYLTVRLDTYSSSLLNEMNRKLFSLTQNDVLAFKDYKESWRNEYSAARLFRNSVITSSIIMLLITLLGLIAYVEDEIFRRHKEIAIRKINGASIWNILAMISKDFGYVVMLAMIGGSLLSYVFAQEWLQQFAIQISLHFTFFVFINIFLLGFLLVCICLRSWNTANENPVNSLKVE